MNSSSKIIANIPSNEQICSELSQFGYIIIDNFLDEKCLLALQMECDNAQQTNQFIEAGVGRSANHAIRKKIRGDKIRWLEFGDSAATDAYLAAMENLKTGLNQGLYLGLDAFEHHFSIYPEGAFYQRHLDRF